MNKATRGKVNFEEKFKMVGDVLNLVKEIMLKGFDLIRIKLQLHVFSKMLNLKENM